MIEEKLVRIICSIKDIEFTDLSFFEGKDLFDDLDFDSISILQLISDIEEAFEISFDEEDIVDNIGEFDKIVSYLKRDKKGE